ncbi:hypothetical protein QJS10_CPB22g00477 [Acorus calamus]|uniref:Uncharacterized protein n=1 Tax=Acorus calamus TaxID=4465 RepID=A0AAV9C1B9_ACOCL|nr:hypothetical protein QJS10_CPB22g00477 [Acorus calamus]
MTLWALGLGLTIMMRRANYDATHGDSEARYAIFGSPTHLSQVQSSSTPVFSGTPRMCHRLKSTIVGRICPSSTGSCSSEGTLFSVDGISLEDDAASICHSPVPHLREIESAQDLEFPVISSTQEGVPRPDRDWVVESPVHHCDPTTPYNGSPGCHKVRDIGVLVECTGV